KNVARAAAPRAKEEAVPLVQPDAPSANVVQSPMELALAKKREELAGLSTKYTSLHPRIIALTQEIKELEAQVAEQATSRARLTSPKPAVIQEATAPTPPFAALPEVDPSDFQIAELEAEVAGVNKDIAAASQAKQQIAAKMALYET